jgi:hypothetical protein
MGAITIFIMLINTSPIGFSCAPNAGKKVPTKIPKVIATNT